MCNEGHPVQLLHCIVPTRDVDREGKCRAVSVGFASSTTAAKCPRTGGFEHQLAYYSRHSAIQVVVGSRHTWLSGGCTWAVIKRIVKVRIAFWLLEVLPEMWHFSILLLLALSDNPPLTSFNRNWLTRFFPCIKAVVQNFVFFLTATIFK